MVEDERHETRSVTFLLEAQRRDDPDVADRLRVWRRSVVQVLTAILLVSFLIALRLRGGTLGAGIRDFDGYVLGAFGLIVLLSRYVIRRLPAFLST